VGASSIETIAVLVDRGRIILYFHDRVRRQAGVRRLQGTKLSMGVRVTYRLSKKSRSVELGSVLRKILRVPARALLEQPICGLKSEANAVDMSI
jgi:hypothetical protein